MAKFKTSILIILVLLFLPACSGNLKMPSGSNGTKTPIYPGSKEVKISEEDKVALISDFYNFEGYFLFENTVQIVSTDDILEVIFDTIDKQLADAGWRSDGWGHLLGLAASEWRYKNLYLKISVVDFSIKQIQNTFIQKYGMVDVDPYSRLIIYHIRDESQPLPNLTATEQKSIQNATGTVESANRSASATAESIKKHATATAQSYTATVEKGIQNQTATVQKAIQDQTATAQVATQHAKETAAVYATATAQAEKEAMIAQLNAQNQFSATELPSSWKIERENPLAGDLDSRVGWLHIVGENVDGDSRNVFSQTIDEENISLITQVQVIPDFKNSFGKECIIIRMQSDNPDDGYVRLAFGYDQLEFFDYFIRLSACDQKSCFTSEIASETIAIENNQPLFLKLTHNSSIYAVYYSFDGENWTYFSEVNKNNDASLLNKVNIEAYSNTRDFDAYVDFIHYNLIVDGKEIETPFFENLETLSESAAPEISKTPDPDMTATPSATPGSTTQENGLYEFETHTAEGRANILLQLNPTEWEEVKIQSGSTKIANTEVSHIFNSKKQSNCALAVGGNHAMGWEGGDSMTFTDLFGKELLLGKNYYYWVSFSNDSDVTLVYRLASAKEKPTDISFIGLAPQSTWETRCKPLVRAVLTNVKIIQP